MIEDGIEASTRPQASGRPKVCFYLNSWTFGGVEEHVATLASQLPALGYDAVVVCADRHELQPLYERLSNHDVPIRLERTKGGPVGVAASVANLTRVLRAERADLLHVQLIYFDGGRVPLVASRLAGIPAVVTHHAAPRSEAERGDLRKRQRLLRGVDRFIAVSEANRTDQVRYLGLPPGRVTVVRNGIHLPAEADHDAAHRALTHELGLPPDAKLIAAVGRLVDQKAFHRLVEAAAHVAHRVPDAHVLFIGDGPLQQDLQAQAAGLGINDMLHFLGFRRDVHRVLAGVDLLAITSLYEGLPLALLETFAASRPVVAFAIDGIPEVIEDGVNGFLVEPEDVPQLTDRLLTLLEHPDRCDAMGRRARETAVRQFSAERMAAQTTEIYDQVRAAAGQRPRLSRRSRTRSLRGVSRFGGSAA